MARAGRHAAVAFCPKAEVYLVARQAENNADWAIFARYLGKEGSPGSVYRVGDVLGADINSAVARDLSGARFLAVWQAPSAQSAEKSVHPAVAGGTFTFLTPWEHEVITGNATARQIHARRVSPYALAE